ncbi:hypothetical protein FEM48_Zijuj11G0013200 [Ziziphus jujuba var. spinosa]|uniref:Uncharacterized protein n=1 Tax=Ziziphus jujuba var. spinosa TaxID=714518 RepID=A0A978UG07_ZIZJJ|nr:hypothetical protein FEM48_Zijuj11G0013200 [Ziziphus jujuba var. spinosa]
MFLENVNKDMFGGSASEPQSNAAKTFFSGSEGSTTLGGKASLQPKRTPVSNEEIEAILVHRKWLTIARYVHHWVAASDIEMELQGGYLLKNSYYHF